MDKPRAEKKPSAFDAEAKELDKRLDQLASDYGSLFLRFPHAEGRPSVEAIDKAQVLAALRVHPWRKKLSSLANELQREAFGEGQRRTPGPGSHGIQRGPAPSPSADSGGLEPPTPGSVGRCSIQLSYESPGARNVAAPFGASSAPDWRRGRDSNPRYGSTPYGRLASDCLRPLGHLSKKQGFQDKPRAARPAGGLCSRPPKECQSALRRTP